MGLGKNMIADFRCGIWELKSAIRNLQSEISISFFLQSSAWSCNVGSVITPFGQMIATEQYSTIIDSNKSLMALYSEAELDVKAKATVFSLDRNLAENSIVKEISDLYLTFCESSKAKQLSMKPRTVTEGVELRLLFELLCFTSFLTSQIIPNYVSTRKLLIKKTNYELVRYYSGQVAKHLTRLCQDLGMTKLREIIFISQPPDVKIKLGDPLHPTARLSEYAECHARRKGGESQRFAQHLSKAMDPYHYPDLEALWNPLVTTLKRLAQRAMAEIFKPSVKLTR